MYKVVYWDIDNTCWYLSNIHIHAALFQLALFRCFQTPFVCKTRVSKMLRFFPLNLWNSRFKAGRRGGEIDQNYSCISICKIEKHSQRKIKKRRSCKDSKQKDFQRVESERSLPININIDRVKFIDISLRNWINEVRVIDNQKMEIVHWKNQSVGFCRGLGEQVLKWDSWLANCLYDHALPSEL